MRFLKENGIMIFGAELKNAVDISKADFSVPCAVILGSEGEGISKDLLKLCDEKVKIPMTGKTSSLNVSVSAGIILNEIGRSRNK